jgi:anti-anti-sigma factor
MHTITATAGDLVILAGRVDASTVSTFRETLHRAVDCGQGPLVVDLAGVELIDATGLGMLAGTQRRARQAGRHLVLRNVPTRTARLLRVTRLDRVLPQESASPISLV